MQKNFTLEEAKKEHNRIMDAVIELIDVNDFHVGISAGALLEVAASIFAQNTPDKNSTRILFALSNAVGDILFEKKDEFYDKIIDKIIEMRDK